MNAQVSRNVYHEIITKKVIRNGIDRIHDNVITQIRCSSRCVKYYFWHRIFFAEA